MPPDEEIKLEVTDMNTGRKEIQRLSALALSLALLAGCGQGGSPAASSGGPASGSGASSGQGETYTIGVIQYMEHPAMDQCYEGFVQALKDNGYDNVVYDLQNGQGDTTNLSTIADRFVSRKVDMVLAIATDAAQAIAGKTTEIPILATAVTSYTVAGLVDSDEAPGGNLTGTSDMNPVAAQIQLIADLVPGVQTIGLAYNSSEDNSVLQIKLAKEAIEAMGLAWTEVTITNSSEAQQAMLSLVSKCDAVYIPTDNTMASAMATVGGVTTEAKIPTVCGADTMVLEGGLATMGINYYELGYQTGLMAIQVMQGADPGQMPIQYAQNSDAVTINGEIAEEIGYVVPEQYASCVVYPES